MTRVDMTRGLATVAGSPTWLVCDRCGAESAKTNETEAGRAHGWHRVRCAVGWTTYDVHINARQTVRRDACPACSAHLAKQQA